MEYKKLSPATYPNEAPLFPSDYGKASTPFIYKDIKKSLEKIASDPKPKQGQGTLETMFSDKAKTLKASVNALLEEIKLREDLNAYQFKTINGEICRQHTDLMQLENFVGCYSGRPSKYADEAKAKIKTNVLELEREKRSEGLECWRDLMFLKRYLMGSLKDYWELVRKREVLDR